MFTREELQTIRDKAAKEAEVPGLNSDWRRAYDFLANAADHLDAMIARTVAQAVKEEVDASGHLPGE